jgi:hypothetical protein
VSIRKIIDEEVRRLGEAVKVLGLVEPQIDSVFASARVARARVRIVAALEDLCAARALVVDRVLEHRP